MKTTRQVSRASRRLFRLCLVNGSLDEGRIRQVVQGVLRSKHRGCHALLSNFLRLVRLDRSQHTAEVGSAAFLPADLKASLESDLRRVYGSGITISFALSPALIGGMRIKVGSDVYDGSVKAGLAALEKTF